MIKKFKDFILEGVGDKYAEKQFNIEDVKLNKYNAIKTDAVDEIIGTFDRSRGIVLVKNPKNLDGFKFFVRAVIMNNGDMYIVNSPTIMHDEILDMLDEKNILTYNEHWSADTTKNNFVTIQRFRNTNDFYLGDSNTHDEDGDIANINWYKTFLNIASKKHKFINFKLESIHF